MNEKARRELEDRAAKLAALKQHPSWEEWRSTIERRKEKEFRTLITDYLKLGKPVDQRAFDRVSAFYEGTDYALGCVEKAEDTLNRALREATAREELSVDS